jgi:hypothetical protein
MSSATAPAAPVSVPFDTIQDTGTYVCNWNGFLLRVPSGALTPGRGRLINIVGSEPLLVTRISEDPALPVHQARELAQEIGLRVNF